MYSDLWPVVMQGFDGSSQATAAARTVLLPLLSNLSDNEDVEAQVIGSCRSIPLGNGHVIDFSRFFSIMQ